MATRIESKHRTVKKVIGKADVGATPAWTSGKKPRLDKRGFPGTREGWPIDVEITVTV
jgi:hypothetical protein